MRAFPYFSPRGHRDTEENKTEPELFRLNKTPPVATRKRNIVNQGIVALRDHRRHHRRLEKSLQEEALHSFLSLEARVAPETGGHLCCGSEFCLRLWRSYFSAEQFRRKPLRSMRRQHASSCTTPEASSYS